MKTTSGRLAFGLVALLVLSTAAMVALPTTGASGRGADVIVTGLTAEATPAIGDNITVSFNLENIGNADADTVTISAEAINGTETIDLGSWPFVGIVDNTTANATSFPWDSTVAGLTPTPGAVYTLTVTAGNSTDDNASNNAASTTVTWGGPDLSVTGFTHDAGLTFNLVEGDGINLTVVVTNDGPGDALAFDVTIALVTVSFTGINTTVDVVTWSDLSLERAGGVDVWTNPAFQFNATSAMVDDIVTFTARIDAGAALTLPGFLGDQIFFVDARLPDLVVGTLVVTGSATGPIRAGDTVTIATDVTNIDGWAYTAATDVEATLWIDGDEIEVKNLGTILIDDTTDVEFEWVTTAADNGSHDVAVSAYDTVLDDGSDFDNEESATVVIGTARVATFEITAVVASELPALPDVGDKQNLTLNVTVKNIGEAPGTPSVKVYAKGQETGVPLAEIASTMALAVDQSWSTDIVLEAVTSEDDVVWDFNLTTAGGSPASWFESNATIEGDLDLPVLAGTITADKTTLELTQANVTLTVAVTNSGDGPAPDVDDEVWAVPADDSAAGSAIGTVSLGEVNASATVTGSLVFMPTLVGNWLFEINVSGHSAASGQVTTTPTLTGGLQLNITAGAKIRGEVAAGGKKTAKIEVSVTNTGTGKMENIKVVIKDSKGTEVGNGTIASLDAKKTDKVTVTIKVSEGKKEYTVTATGTFRGKTFTATGDGKIDSKVDTTPGFEAVVMLGALAIAFVLLRRRRQG